MSVFLPATLEGFYHVVGIYLALVLVLDLRWFFFMIEYSLACFKTNPLMYVVAVYSLSSIIAQERLERITECVKEMNLVEQVPSMVKTGSLNPARQSSPSPDDPDGWMESAIPVNSVLGATAAAAGMISASEMDSFASRGSGHMSLDRNSECASPQPLPSEVEPQESGHVTDTQNGMQDPAPVMENGFRGGMEVSLICCFHNACLTSI